MKQISFRNYRILYIPVIPNRIVAYTTIKISIVTAVLKIIDNSIIYKRYETVGKPFGNINKLPVIFGQLYGIDLSVCFRIFPYINNYIDYSPFANINNFYMFSWWNLKVHSSDDIFFIH